MGSPADALLRQALAEPGMTLVRDPQAVATDRLVNEGGPDLAIEGTERRRQRPKDADQQGETYSGKKKSHTIKVVYPALPRPARPLIRK